MKFLELNKKRHAIKHFTDQPVDPKDVRTAIEIATLAPSAHNSQPWKFVVVRQKNAELAKVAYGGNYDQIMEAPVTIALFTDTRFATSGSEDCACWWGQKLHRGAVAILHAKPSCRICSLQ